MVPPYLVRPSERSQCSKTEVMNEWKTTRANARVTITNVIVGRD